jgi:hypothetical protein
VTGLAFITLDGRDFNVGDELSVEFTLDDEYQTEFKKDIIVRDVGHKSVGCEFEKSEDAFGSPLGYYVTQNL